ncbi:RNA-induced silencing complex nuclease component Tudor-SN [Penicillium macrosclerotiorum]|uniref:RNA-induced silencing complex nuclease component Tudor-SN n=1 Tax=Penicillium macrosclerotiorum TaxID=303699 RepID=UPI0025486978|nr:RNA-induced silencing complex nuclease component Tudor-SN [Penicillium macrosclerotiorum]KAJ5689195.1 RNA-induced silencing complex nuclease component Tudor-SN [Penicillium macrosclerotiorum]
MVKAVAVLRGDAKISGTVTFEQADENTPTTISWNITGHDANAQRGFHVHQFGDNTNGCTSAGPHFNPFGKTHGAPEDSERHVGDLGNFTTDAEGNAVGSKSDPLVKLIGAESVLGRTLVVHAGTDDLGKGGNEESKKTGNAGPRPACGYWYSCLLDTLYTLDTLSPMTLGLTALHTAVVGPALRCVCSPAANAQTAFPTNTGHVSPPEQLAAPFEQFHSFVICAVPHLHWVSLIFFFCVEICCCHCVVAVSPSSMPFEARVKSVLSGDTVVLSHVTNPTQERILSLAYVSAPRLRREGDEAYGFQSREFLRELLVGKVIQFHVVYTIPTGAKREYGIIKLPGFDAQLPDISVQEGWTRVREEAGKRSDDSGETLALLDRLRALESLAQDENKGVWAASDKGQIETIYELSSGQQLVSQFKGQQLEGIIEKVLNGDRVVLRLLLEPQEHLQTVVAVAGIRAPAAKRTTADGKEQPAEPFGDEAQQFFESRLLQRKVKVSLLGVTPQGQLVATLLHPNGNIARFLLEAGLARCQDHHSTMLGGDMAILRQAERTAKDARLGVFTGHVGAKASAGAAADYTVSRVLNADTIFIRNKTGEEKKISLTSIRQPKPSDPKQAPFAADAKEFLRKRVIAKHVKVTVNGKKPATEGYEEREVATVVQGNTNVGLALVEAGYASVIRHRMDDDDRSPDYDDLLIAESEAQKEGRGMWSPKPPKAKQYQDYSESVQKAKLEVGVLQRSKRVPAVVDFVKSGSRFTVLVPRENAKLTLVLSGIRAPRSARGPGEAGEPFGQEAHELANRRCMQRDVEIDVETIDKVGGFIGTLYVNKENFTKVLLEEGLATVHAYSAEQSGHANEYFAAEQRAKDARKGLWHDWDPSKEAAEAEESEAANTGTESDAAPLSRKKDYRDVMVTYIDPASGSLKLQQIGTGTSALTELMSAFRAFHINKANDTPLPGPPKAGDWVAAQFTEDGNWYRARVRRNDREKEQAEVVYIDFGNSESLPWSSLRPLTQPQFSAQKLRPQAVDAVLSFLQFPASPDYLADAIGFVGDQTFDRQLVANVDHVDPEGKLHVTLLDPAVSKSLDQSINADIIFEGMAMIPRKLKAWERASAETLDNLRELEDEAKAERRGMWEYGDLTED